MNSAGHVRELIVDKTDKSGFHIVKQQDCEQIIKAIKAAPEHMVRARLNTQNSQKYLGSVPSVLAVAWAKEWGVKLFSKEWSKLSADRLKNDPNWRQLRAEH